MNFMWAILKCEVLDMPLASPIRNAVDNLVESSCIVVREPQFLLDLNGRQSLRTVK